MPARLFEGQRSDLCIDCVRDDSHRVRHRPRRKRACCDRKGCRQLICWNRDCGRNAGLREGNRAAGLRSRRLRSSKSDNCIGAYRLFQCYSTGRRTSSLHDPRYNGKTCQHPHIGRWRHVHPGRYSSQIVVGIEKCLGEAKRGNRTNQSRIWWRT